MDESVIPTGFTPGPWAHDRADHISAPNGQDVALVGRYTSDPDAEADANARLIALAPTMAAELTRLRAENAALEAGNAQLRTDAAILLANLDHIEKCTGEGPEGEDRALVEQIRATLGLTATTSKIAQTNTGCIECGAPLPSPNEPVCATCFRAALLAAREAEPAVREADHG